MDIVILNAGGMILEIAPGLGGAVTRFTSDSFPIFRDAPATFASVSDCASFPLIPFSNRIRGGRFNFLGTDYKIPVDRRDERFTNHGHTRHLPWQVMSACATELTLQFVQAEPSLSWPFAFTAEQIFTLAPGRLTMQARIRNDHPQAAPAGLGFHPYFTRLPGTRLGFFAKCVWEPDSIDIPVRSLTPTENFDFAKRKALEQPLINHAYGGWNKTAEIIHPTGLQITIGASGAFDHLILFTPEGKNFFGFEPVSHRPDGLNPVSDPRDAGMAVLRPGESLDGRMDITITRTQ